MTSSLQLDQGLAGTRSACRILLEGRVQGLGVRPAIYRLARQLELAGQVSNTADGVEIVVEGQEALVKVFREQLEAKLPLGADIAARADTLVEVLGREPFAIVREPSASAPAARVPPDVRVCDACLEEVFDARNRRHRYALTSCTQCGPRYSILQAMPYERETTSMRAFALCSSCRDEYRLAESRRFHAQTNACGQCGPQVWVHHASGRRQGAGDEAVRVAVAALRAGQIVALKGVGGYQLLVDATHHDAVARLRTRKRRPSKPLAVMVAALADARALAVVDEAAAAALQSRANPIVLLMARRPARLASNVHAGLAEVGVMLPTTPLHALLSHDVQRPLVCTSGNVEGEPLAYQEDVAEEALRGVCDVWLHHDRSIVRPIDDSVVRVAAGRPVTLRLARGLAPLPLAVPTGRRILALGGHMKAAAAWSNGRQAVLGPHVGDLESVATRERFLAQLDAWQSLYGGVPDLVVHDQHPGYFTTRHAREGLPPALAVQHHHAHVVAAMLEHGWLDRTVLGVAWDGTGDGGDGTVWGGEFLVCTARRARRLATLLPFALPGGERAVREPWRTALAVIASATGEAQARAWRVGDVSPGDLGGVLSLLGKPRFAPRTSSAGRLFDAVAHIALGVSRVDYEGQAAMMLEGAADVAEEGAYDVPIRAGDPWLLDWRPLIQKLLAERDGGASPGVLSMRFHRSLANGIVSVCCRRPDLPVLLAGGAFQNRLLTELVVEQMSEHKLPLGPPGIIPPGDGGLAAGQLAVAAAQVEQG